jgi:UDPglucose 6-dehydrogenase
LDGLTVAPDPYGACEGAVVLALLTDWDEFRWLDLSKVAQAMAGTSIVDARNLLDRNEVRRLGFTYVGIGR